MNSEPVEQEQHLSRTGNMVIPAMMIPGFRTSVAIQDGVERNLLFRTWGGLGDQICAEPTLRYVLKNFEDCQISLASEQPELFSHLKFHRVFDLKKERPIYEDYLLFDTITPPDDSNLVWQFFGHMTTNCVDFPSLCAIRSQLPIKDREVKLIGSLTAVQAYGIGRGSIAVHPGKHWESKTFPKDWWDAVLAHLIVAGHKPVLIGADTDDNRGTVDVNPVGCLDLRNKLSIKQSIGLLHTASVLLTNDSSPLHMAVSGQAHIGYIATCKHPDMITHWRKGGWGWRMVNHGLGGFWDVMDFCPNKENKIEVDKVDESLLRSWLPSPQAFAKWAIDKAALHAQLVDMEWE